MTIALRHEIVGPADSPHRLRIAHLSDFHLLFSDRKLGTIERLLAPWQPDVLALTGDYADTPRGRRMALAWITRMAETYPLCWVAGNHDHWFGRRFLQTLAAVPHAHPVDHRDAVITGADGHPYRFTSWDRMATSASPLSSCAPTVVLLHNPAEIAPEKLSPTGNHLLLAGHVHGGQITLWRDRQGRSQPAATFYSWVVDRATIGTTPLIVSRGLGAMVPFRFRAPEEIVIIDFAG